jgi:hypothetical protein
MTSGVVRRPGAVFVPIVCLFLDVERDAKLDTALLFRDGRWLELPTYFGAPNLLGVVN